MTKATWTPAMEKRARGLLVLCDGPRADIEDALSGALDALDGFAADAARAEADAIHAKAERDEARAALAALREAVARTNETMESLRIDDLDASEAARTLRWVRELRAALLMVQP